MTDAFIQVVSLILLFYPIIGTYQLVTAFYRYFFIKDLNAAYKTMLKKYLILVVVYFIIFLIIWNVFDLERNVNLNEEITILYTLIPPMGFAYYYWKIRKHKKVKQ